MWSPHTGDSLELSATSPSVLSHHFWGLSDFETNWTGSCRGQGYTMTQTLLRSNYKVSTTIRTFSHELFQSILSHLVYPLGLWAFCDQENKKKTKQNKTALLWMLSRKEQLCIHNPTRQSTRAEEIIHSYPRSLIKVLLPPELSALYLYIGAEVKIKLSYKLHLSPVNYFHSKNSCYVNPPISEKELHISKNSILILITQKNLGLGSGVQGGNGWSGRVVVGETQLD